MRFNKNTKQAGVNLYSLRKWLLTFIYTFNV